MEALFYQTQDLDLAAIAQALVRVGAQDWVDQIVVGAVGLAIYPLLITAAIGALQQNNALHEVLRSIDYQVRRQQPQAQTLMPPSNLWMPPTYAGMPPTNV
jgi:hypothetical protein